MTKFQRTMYKHSSSLSFLACNSRLRSAIDIDIVKYKKNKRLSFIAAVPLNGRG